MQTSIRMTAELTARVYALLPAVAAEMAKLKSGRPATPQERAMAASIGEAQGQKAANAYLREATRVDHRTTPMAVLLSELVSLGLDAKEAQLKKAKRKGTEGAEGDEATPVESGKPTVLESRKSNVLPMAEILRRRGESTGSNEG